MLEKAFLESHNNRSKHYFVKITAPEPVLINMFAY